MVAKHNLNTREFNSQEIYQQSCPEELMTSLVSIQPQFSYAYLTNPKQTRELFEIVVNAAEEAKTIAEVLSNQKYVKFVNQRTDDQNASNEPMYINNEIEYKQSLDPKILPALFLEIFVALQNQKIESLENEVNSLKTQLEIMEGVAETYQRVAKNRSGE